MRVGKSVWMLALVAALATGAAIAAETAEPAETATAGLETEAEPVAGSAADEAVATGTGGGPQGFTCSCECTCPASGHFEVQIFELPAWTNRSCQSFDGDGCTLSTPDTCNTPRRYQNCQEI